MRLGRDEIRARVSEWSTTLASHSLDTVCLAIAIALDKAVTQCERIDRRLRKR